MQQLLFAFRNCIFFLMLFKVKQCARLKLTKTAANDMDPQAQRHMNGPENRTTKGPRIF